MPFVALMQQTADASCGTLLPAAQMEEIAAIPGVDMLFLGQNDLCMSMGLYEKYEFPHMYEASIHPGPCSRPTRRLTCLS